MSKLSVIAASVVALPIVTFSGSALAATQSQFEGGDIYYGRNVTKNQAFALGDVNATCGETVQLRVRIHNPGPDLPIDNVKVLATLPGGKATSFTSTVTVSSPNADPKSVSDTATVKSDKTASLSYVNGSTQLVAANGTTVLSTLGDTITSSGVTLPSAIGVSLDNKRFVQFSAKLNCETTPTTPETPEQPAELTKTGAGDIVALFAVVAAAGAVAYNWVLRRQTR